MKTLRNWGIAGMLGLVFCLQLHAAPTPEEQRMAEWQSQIERASEAGDFRTVQAVRRKLADFAADTKRYDVAARQYELLLAARPRRSERVKLFVKLGLMRMALEDYSQAISSFQDALHDSPGDWDANLECARAFSSIDMHSRAIEFYLHCIHLKPQKAVSYEELAEVYETEGFLRKALTYYQKALLLEPKPEIYLHMADCYEHLKDMTQAIAILTQAKAQLPTADYDVRLGEIYENLGDLTHAASAWEDALKADAKRDDVRLKLTLIYDRLKRPQETDRLFTHLLATYPQSPLVHLFHALVLWDRGEKAASRKEALAAQALNPTDLVSHYNELLLNLLRKTS